MNCKIIQTVLVAAVIVFTFWVTAWGKWVVLAAALLILWHAWKCKNCVASVPAGLKEKAVGKGKK